MTNIYRVCGSKCCWFSDRPKGCGFDKMVLERCRGFWKDLYTYLSHFDALRNNKKKTT
jgi:hypothetical protein